MADMLYVLTLAFALPIVNVADNCKTLSLIGLTFSEYCSYGCCTDYDHVGFEKCCDSNYAVGTIVGIVVGCVIVVGIIISVIVCCVCCTWNIRGMQGQTVTTVAGGPYVMNPMPHGVQMGQSPYGSSHT
ncbi:uncharacterized protein LOC128209730 [Mya arenaria]|uniref:uncharacterized protein LOC128209730 n=1 Tax=Mya arenaria TaxID=6604 RepID=UPI0022E93C3F|nr:uncharacterized protein LOC128209730 [Mya arenaria]